MRNVWPVCAGLSGSAKDHWESLIIRCWVNKGINRTLYWEFPGRDSWSSGIIGEDGERRHVQKGRDASYLWDHPHQSRLDLRGLLGAAVLPPWKTDRPYIDPSNGREVARIGFITGRNENDPILRKKRSMNFRHLASNFTKKEYIVHPVVAHCQSVANVRGMKLRCFSSILIDALEAS